MPMPDSRVRGRLVTMPPRSLFYHATFRTKPPQSVTPPFQDCLEPTEKQMSCLKAPAREQSARSYSTSLVCWSRDIVKSIWGAS